MYPWEIKSEEDWIKKIKRGGVTADDQSIRAVQFIWMKLTKAKTKLKIKKHVIAL